MNIRTHLRSAIAAGLVAGMALAATAASAAETPRYRTAAELPADLLAQLPTTAADMGLDFAPRLVLVQTSTQAQRSAVASSGLDVTEHAGHDYVEVVIADQAQQDMLDSLGYRYEVSTPDLIAQEHERIMADAAFFQANALSALPSGRTVYRVLADFKVEIDDLVAANPDLAKAISLGKSFEGRELDGIEIGVDVNGPEDGRPVLLMFGNHHAREWPSAETPMEFAYDLINRFNDGDARTVDLLGRARVVIVPVSNPDGFDASRTSGDFVDLNPIDGGDTVSILATPGNAYKRKNCNPFTGQPLPEGGCLASPSPGGQGIGVDLNRNYGALWGGPGAVGESPDPNQSINGAGNLSAIYRGEAPFSEPETQAIRSIISTRQVTTLISNHTFSSLLLRPVGVQPNTVGPDEFPIGFAPDECFTTPGGEDLGMQTLGELMTAQTGYTNQFGWELYDTTGTTEDYSYNATGGYGYTFEIGKNQFHPPFEEVVAEYIGTSPEAEAVTMGNFRERTTATAQDCPGTEIVPDSVGGGLAEAYFLALENAANEATHSLITGEAPAGAVIGVSRTGTFKLWDKSDFEDTVSTTMVVPTTGEFEYHVNPSTRPFEDSRPYSSSDSTLPPFDEFSKDTFTGTALDSTPDKAIDIEVPAGMGIDSLVLELTADAPNDYDLELYGPDAELIDDSAGPDSIETIVLQNENGLTPGTYTARVINFSSVGPWSMDVTLGTIDGDTTGAPLLDTPRDEEAWTVTCTVDGETVATEQVIVDRGEQTDLGEFCVVAAGGVDPAPDSGDLAATGGGATALALGLLALAGIAVARRRQDTSEA